MHIFWRTFQGLIVHLVRFPNFTLLFFDFISQFWIFKNQDCVTRMHIIVRNMLHANNDTPLTHNAVFETASLDNTRRRKRIGHRQIKQHAHKRRKNKKRQNHSTATDLRQSRPRKYILEELTERDNKHCQAKQSSHYERQNQVMFRNCNDKPCKQDESVNSTRYAIERVNKTLAPRICNIFGIVLAEHITFKQILQMTNRTLLQIGHIQQVRENVVSVKTHQRVHVKQHRRNGADDKNIVSKRL